jgi:hypothetical protein
VVHQTDYSAAGAGNEQMTFFHATENLKKLFFVNIGVYRAT